MPRLHIVDGHNYLYRAYYGLMKGGVRLSTQAGMPTGALHVYASMLLRLYLDENPERIVVVFDAPGRSFRSEMDNAYKANRRPMPDDLKVQMPYFRPLTESFHWPVIEVKGVEADDVIATLTRLSRERGWDVTIYSRDKDLMQLLDAGTTVVDAMDRVVYDDARVRTKYGVGPEQLRDWLALVGDASDNVPGVAGVGKKSATKLLTEYGSIDGIVANTSLLKGKLKQRFEDATQLERLMLSRQLVTLKDDVELGVELNELRRGAWDGIRLKRVLRELEFETMLERLEPGGSGDVAALDIDAPTASSAAATELECATVTIDSEMQLNALVADVAGAKRVALHVEMDAQRPVRAEVVGIALAVRGKPAVYVPVGHRYLGAPTQLSDVVLRDALTRIVTQDGLELVCHDAKTLAAAFARLGMTLPPVACDTMLAAYLVAAATDTNDVAVVLSRYANVSIQPRSAVVGKGKAARGFDAVSVEIATEYAGRIASALLRAGQVLSAQLRAACLVDLHRDIEEPLAHILCRMERVGVRVDDAHLRRLADGVSAKIAALEAQAHELAGEVINLGSPKQLAALLFGKLQLTSPRMKKTKTGYSTNHEVLDAMRGMHPVVEAIVAHRELVKLKNTYLDALPPLVNPTTGRVHTSFRQAIAATGRLSSAEPNLQNIPVRSELGRAIRRAFVAAEGKRIVSCDYSQIELRLLAHYCEDPTLIDAFRDGIDVHAQTASEILSIPLDEVGPAERRIAKAVNYGLIYGQSAFGLSRALDIERGEAARYIERYFARFTRVRVFFERLIDDTRLSGVSTTILGRRRPIPELASRSARVRNAAERVARNTPLQGSGADILKLAMLRCARIIDQEQLEARMILTVHDELVFEVAAACAADVGERLRTEMETVYELKVPLVVELGIADNWADAH